MTQEADNEPSDGFAVYLSPAELAKSDEYANGNPYTIHDGLVGPFQRRRVDITLQLLRELGSLSRILDVGCGDGQITNEVKRAFPEAEIHGLDYSISAIRRAHQSFPEIRFCVADAVKSPYPEGPFDVVICNNLWEHVSDPIGLLTRIGDVLRPHGSVIISTPSRYRTSNLLRALLGRPIAFMSRYHVTEYSVGQVKEQLHYGGFEVERAITRPGGGESIKSRAAGALFGAWLSLTGSHHQLEGTVFYSARRKF